MVGGGSKSAKGGPNPLADMDRGGPNPRGVQIRCDTGLARLAGLLRCGLARLSCNREVDFCRV